MPADKYTLPEVDSLKKIGFEFEYSKLKDVLPYIKNFVDSNIESLKSNYFPDRTINPLKGSNSDVIVWADPNKIEDDFYDDTEKKLIEKIIRIEKGKIKLHDYAFLVHRKYRKDKDVLLKALNRRLRSIYGATGNLLERRGIWNLDFNVSVVECVYHKVLDNIILRIASSGMIGRPDWNKDYFNYKKKKDKAEVYSVDNPGRILPALGLHWEADKELMKLSDDVFSSNATLETYAMNIMLKARMGGPIVDHIEKKEKTISYYLRLQAKTVNKARDNRKSNKGVQKGKRKAVIEEYTADPTKSITQIVKDLSPGISVTRKTAAKYIREYEVSKNNPLK